MKKTIYSLLKVLLIICILAIVGGIVVAFYSFTEEPKNNTLGLIGSGICFGGLLLSFIVATAANKIVDRFGPLYEPESKPVTLPEKNEAQSPNEDREDQAVNAESRKLFSKIGRVISIVVFIIMIAGIVFAYFGNKVDDGKHSLVTFGVLLAVAPVLILLAMALLPEKMRGVKRKPRKERALEILIILSILMAVGGVFSILGILIFNRENKELYIAAGICAVIGTVGAFVLPNKYKQLIGKSNIRIEVFPSDEDVEKAAYNALNKLGAVDTVLDEEQERELKRIEEQNRKSSAAPMTKEQVELYEDQRHGRK